jgi:hypothetical protein
MACIHEMVLSFTFARKDEWKQRFNASLPPAMIEQPNELVFKST